MVSVSLKIVVRFSLKYLGSNIIANKLHMWIVLYSDSDEDQNTVKMQVDELIKRGEAIGKEEYHAASGGFPFSYVAGPKYDMWMAEINVLSERHLKTHPAYESIHTFYKQRANNPSAYEEMLAQLRVASVYKGIHIKTTKNGLPTY